MLVCERHSRNMTFNVKRIEIYMLKWLVLHFNRLVNAYMALHTGESNSQAHTHTHSQDIQFFVFIHNWYFESFFVVVVVSVGTKVIFNIVGGFFFSLNIWSRQSKNTEYRVNKRGLSWCINAFVMCRRKYSWTQKTRKNKQAKISFISFERSWLIHDQAHTHTHNIKSSIIITGFFLVLNG